MTEQKHQCGCSCHQHPYMEHIDKCCDYTGEQFPHPTTNQEENSSMNEQDNKEQNVKIQNSGVSGVLLSPNTAPVFIGDAAPATLTAAGRAEINAVDPESAIDHESLAKDRDAKAEEDRVAKVEEEAADNSYERFRAAIGKKVTEALQSGKILVQEKPFFGTQPGDLLESYGPMDYKDWHLSLPHSQHQHYNCNYCNAVWTTLASLGVMDDNGKITYPVVDAAIELAEAGDEIANKALVRADLKKRNRPQYMPVAQLPISRLAKQTVGGFEHFYAAEDIDVLNAYSDKHSVFADFKYVDHLFQQIIANELNVDLLTKLFVYIKANIGDLDHTALSRSDALIELIRKVRHVQKESRNGPLLLWTFLQSKENLWMRHINGSVLGIVLDTAIELKDTEDMAGALSRVKSLLARATSEENYKNKTAEASEASIDQAVKFLTDNGLTGTLERRLLPLGDAKQVVWTAEEEQAVAAPQEAAGSALAAAHGELKNEKNPDVKVNAEMDKVLGSVEMRKSVSIEEFARLLPTFKSLAIVRETPHAKPVFVTAASTEGDHAKLLTFVDGIHDTSQLLTTPQPISFDVAARMASDEHLVGIVKSIPVTAVLRADHPHNDVSGYILHIEGFAANFYGQLSAFGTCVLGSMIVGEHFGYSRALTELSKKMKMDVSAGKTAVGGVFARVGTVVLATLQDGTKQRISITSVK